MSPAELGQSVEVDISGLQVAGISVGSGVSAIGRIVQLDPDTQRIVVELEVSFEGHNRVAVDADRVQALATI